VLSSKHYVNQGGAEFVVYRASPADVDSWVRVGDVSYPGFEATGAGIPGDGTTRVAFFALLHDQDLQTPITIVARDAAGNEASTALDRTAFPKSFAKSRIAVTDGFLGRVVPPILAATPDLHVSSDPADLVAAYVTINSDLRQTNGKTIAEQALKTSPTMLWAGAFQQLGNSQVESRFADRRTYVHEGLDIDYQVHLGFDLAVTANVPIAAAQSGTVLLARYLGIYGNCVILDHGLGVQSLYGHLSSIDVAPGARVEQGQALGRSGMTGLAGGDHLHFTMLVGGQAVNPVEWWDPKWMQDRVLRKITEAGGTPPVTP
jgi:murein DD-endopeptidase MepM/ murein hydrolase activator NlpD